MADPSHRSEQGIWLDVAEFRDRLIECRSHGHPAQEVCPACISSLTAAVALYRDDFLAGFTLPDSPAFDEWQFFQTEGLRRELAGALECLARGHSARGEVETGIPYARRWVALDPLHEAAQRCLMRLYARSGQRAAALRQYAACERILGEELSAPPEQETTRLYRAIRERREPDTFVGVNARGSSLEQGQDRPLPGDEDRAHASAVPAAGRPVRAHNLPAQATPFIGREVQLAEVREMLGRPEVRLLTLTGVGGTGKTRLALQVAAGLVDAFADGVCFVALAPIRDPALVVPTVAAALGVRESEQVSLLESLKYALQDRERLLVIDNFEQVVEAAPAVGELLAAASRLKVLVTSRARLHIYGEHEYRVPPMATPGPEDLPPLDRLARVEAVQLFVQRACAAAAGFALDEGNALAVAQICARLDGLPLAIELTAARVRLFSPQSMLPRLGDRLQFLTGGPRDLPARQRTLRATIEWSHDLLDADEQTLFCRLSVFAGGFTLDAAEAVLDPPSILHTLQSLVDQSLLQVFEVDRAPRFTMLETVREYAAERLEESGRAETIRQRHARCFLALAEEAEVEQWGPRVAVWVDRLEGERDNLRAALAWSMAGAGEAGLRLACALGWFWEHRGEFGEGRDWLAQALAQSAAGGPGRDQRRAKALMWAGTLALRQIDDSVAQALLSESVALWREVGDARGLAWALLWLAWADRHDRTTAYPLLEECTALFHQLDDTLGLAASLEFDGGLVAMREGDYERARVSLEESARRARGSGWIGLLGYVTVLLGRVAFIQGDYIRARSFYQESQALSREAKKQPDILYSVWDLARVWYVEGDYDRARAGYQDSLQAFREVGNRIEVGLILAELGYVAMRQGRWGEARARLAEVPALCLVHGYWHARGIATCLVGCAWLAEVGAQPERAARLLGAAEGVQERIDLPYSTLLPIEYERRVSAVRGQLDEAALAAAWTEGRALALATADEDWERVIADALQQDTGLEGA
jgi:predicted ATPase